LYARLHAHFACVSLAIAACRALVIQERRMLDRYDRISKSLHWLVVALVLTQVATGLSWTRFGDDTTARYILIRLHMVSPS